MVKPKTTGNIPLSHKEFIKTDCNVKLFSIVNTVKETDKSFQDNNKYMLYYFNYNIKYKPGFRCVKYVITTV